MNAGTAVFTTSAMATGTHALTAAYAGDGANAAGTSSELLQVVNGQNLFSWHYGHDAMGRLNGIVDPNGATTVIVYYALGRTIQTQQPPNTGSPDATAIDLEYDTNDTLTQVKDPRLLETKYTPDGLGNVKKQESPDSGTTTYTYDANGNVLTSTDARSKTTTYTYDNLNRLKTISYPTGTGTTFEYDGGATPTAKEAGELTKMTDESGITTYAHDALGRLTSKITTFGTKTFTVTYAWGDTGPALDKLTAITYPSGSRVDYSYDSYGDVSGITMNPVNANGSGVSGTATPLLSGITYNVDRDVSGWLWSDSKARTIGYDGNGMITSYTLGDLNRPGF